MPFYFFREDVIALEKISEWIVIWFLQIIQLQIFPNTMTDVQIEVELRSLLDEKKYDELKKFFQNNAEDLGADDKDVFFFILPDKLVKVVNNISKKNAKIVLKLTKIGKGSGFEEVEIPIDREYVDKAVRFFTGLGFNEIQQSFQKRHNYLFKEVEFSLKYSDAWGYHLELEKMVRDQKEIVFAEKEMHQIAAELGINLMSDNELAEFTAKKDKEYRGKNKQKLWI